MADINVTITEAQPIQIIVTEAEPINITIEDGLYSLISSIFAPDEDGHKITKLYIKNGKLKVKYEDGD